MDVSRAAEIGYAGQGSTGTPQVRTLTDSPDVKPENTATETAAAESTIRAQSAPVSSTEESGPEADRAVNQRIKQAVEKINENTNGTEVIFGIHDATNRVTLKVIDKETRDVIKEIPAEKTLDLIAKAWEMAGLIVDDKL